MTHHLRLGPSSKVIVGLVEMSHLHIEIKRIMFGAAFSPMVEEIISKSLIGIPITS